MASTPPAPSSSSSAALPPRADYDDGGLAVVRVKPLGAGAGGGEASAADATDGGAGVEVSAQGVAVSTAKRTRSRAFSYPRHIIPPECGQAGLYETFMHTRIDAFLSGHNVNIMVYGQTGSGKTHTMFGPPGLMARAAAGEFGVDQCPEYGLCPRSMLDIIARVQAMQKSDRNARYTLTACAVELTITQGNICMARKSQGPQSVKNGFFAVGDVIVDRSTKPPRLYGMAEIPLDKPEDALNVFAAIATRNTASTGLNDSSSRSHCFIFLNLYALDLATNSLRTSRFQFADLAGSERLTEAHDGKANWRDGDMGVIEGTMTNFSLMMLSSCVRNLVEATAQKKKFSFRAYLVDLVMLLSESISGSALSLVIVCISSAPANASQSINALDFGEVFSKLSVKPELPETEPLKTVWKRAEKLIESGNHSVASSKWSAIRAAQARDGEQLKSVLLQLAPAP